MIRVALCGVAESVCDEIARRVRGARIAAAGRNPTETGPAWLDDFDAVAWVGPQPPDQARIDQAIDAGRQLLLATDTILSVATLDAIVDRGSAAGVRVIIRNPDQSLPSRRLINDELHGPRLGIPGLICVHRWESASPASAGDPARLPPPLVRDLDLVLWLARQLPNLVFAVQRPGNEAGSGADTFQVHLGFSDGGMGLVDYAGCLPPGDGYQSLSTICSSGAIYADDHANQQLVYRGGGAQAVPADEGLLPLVNLIQQFVDGLAPGGDMPSGIDQWRQVRALADAVRRSLDSGHAVTLEGR